ncbi:Formamidopyrimidine-DNA glycosylase [Candidatus Hepatoplasma crinochetorum Av]|uniref:Formamidopyrimidine-DNA glycosylase n=1 Tax=Candidatus Hepatoplasma crinochetorum Av TaxID=1427984 RepID=W8GK11_9MOLU|nr:DNA-formamidopyrimidine glycosylase [Candidatus Hepatoplasma crinochetorum]AHK22577.1 Formamidopyrimidine-DNA glycosylase [Candidatus Hepatoplasma crinochetorum Av]
MPELPEVNVVAKQLRAILLNDNQRINQINLYYQKSLRNAEKIELENLKNLKPIDVFQIAKNLVIETESKYLILHLRMEGNFKFLNKEELTKIDLIHTIVSFKLNNNNWLLFNDHRKFATIDLFDNNKQIKDNTFFKNLGPEPWDIDFENFYQKIKNSKSTIKSLLLSQKYISGLGNIYVDEVLFAAKIHPQEMTKNIAKKDFKKIIDSAILILKASIRDGGSTIKTFKSFGEKGNFQNKLMVHGKKGLPCKICRTTIEKIVVAGRGTYFCPQEQVLKYKNLNV